MKERSELDVCLELLGKTKVTPPDIPNPPIPEYLFDDYVRMLAADEVAKFPMSPLIEAVVCRAALTENEDDRVRTECVQRLMDSQCKSLETVLLGLLFDKYSDLRRTGLEGLFLIRSESLELAIDILDKDDSPRIKKLVHQIKNGQEIELYHLDAPEWVIKKFS